MATMTLDRTAFVKADSEPIPVLGSAAPNKDHTYSSAPDKPDGTGIQESILVKIDNTLGNATLLTDATNFQFQPGATYKLTCTGVTLGTDKCFFQMVFGDGTDPVAADAVALPAANGGSNGIFGMVWNVGLEPTILLKPIIGQRRLLVKLRGTAFTVTDIFICMSRLR